MTLILVAEDDADIRQLVRDVLEHAGYEVLVSGDGVAALQSVRTRRPDLLVLDLGLPGLDGLDVARAIRRESELPIIMLTARAEESDTLVGLELGADDYVAKPFSTKELVARVRAVLRRAEARAPAARVLRSGDLEVDEERMLVSRDGQRVELTASEFALLATMARSPGRVFTRVQLLDAMHGEAFEAYERAVDAHIKNIRRKLEPVPQQPRYLLTVFGVGYRLAEDRRELRHMSGRRGPPGWWPEGEPWPPPSGSGRVGPWRHRRPGRWRPFGCLILLFGLFAAGAVLMAMWALAAIVGLVDAPPIVTAGGVAAFVLIVVGGLAVGRLLRRMAQPLDELIDASSRIEAGDYTARVEVGGGGELRSLTRAFNQMSAELQATDERRRAFLADVTHELRTPLTVIQGQLEAIEDGVYAAEPARLAALLAQARHMSSLVEDLHTISLAEVGALELQPAPTGPGRLRRGRRRRLRSCRGAGRGRLGCMSHLRGGREHRRRRHPAGAGQPHHATRLRHTPAGGLIARGRSRAWAGGSASSIVDDGSGMEPELAARVFERFEKGADSDGSGLGLAIARDLVGAQDGASTWSRAPGGGGTRVTLRFPAGRAVESDARRCVGSSRPS